MQIDALRHFITLAESGSFYGAADKTYLSPQGLNKEITGIESELGMKLLERRGRHGVRLTKRGEVLLASARTIVGEYDAMFDALTETPPLEAHDSDKIVVTTTFYTSQMLLGTPQVQAIVSNATLRELGFAKLLEAVLESTGDELFLVDIYPNSNVSAEAAEQLEFEPVLETQLGLLWSENGPAVFPETVHREEVTGLPMALSSDRSVARWVDWVFREHPLENVALRTTTSQNMMRFVQQGRFSTFDSYGFHLSELDARVDTRGLRFSPFATSEATARIGFLRNRRAHPSGRAKTYANALRRLFEKAEG